MRFRNVLWLATVLFLSSSAFGKSIELDNKELLGIYERQHEIHDEGMYVVGAWSVLTGAYSFIQVQRLDPGETRCFHKASFAWALINLGIIGVGFWANSQRPDNITLEKISREVAFSKYFYTAKATECMKMAK